MVNTTKLITLLAAAFLCGVLFATPAFADPANAGAGWGGGGGTGMDPAGMGPGPAGYVSSHGTVQPVLSSADDHGQAHGQAQGQALTLARLYFHTAATIAIARSRSVAIT